MMPLQVLKFMPVIMKDPISVFGLHSLAALLQLSKQTVLLHVFFPDFYI